MPNFCENCGSRLNADGTCPNCGYVESDQPDVAEISPSASSVPSESSAFTAAELPGTSSEPEKIVSSPLTNKKKKSKKVLWICILSFIALILFSSSVLGLLVYYDVVNIPFINNIYASLGLKDEIITPAPAEVIPEQTEPAPEDDSTAANNDVDLSTPYKVTPPDADAYFQNNASVSSSFLAPDSPDVHTESEAYDNLTSRGFTQEPITTEYSMTGEYDLPKKISSGSNAQHPMYQTSFVSATGDMWDIFEINGAIVAVPLSYNFRDESTAYVMISETATITSYDSTTNKFYVNTPNSSVATIKTIGRIDAETLNNLTVEAIDSL